MREHPDPDLLDDFAYANTLHQNFYGDALGVDSVRRGSEVVKGFVKKVKKLLPPPQKPILCRLC